MSAELLCPHHGPYDASYGTCPYCSGDANRPPAPDPLEDELPTEIGGAAQPGGYPDEAPTEIGRAGGEFDDFDPTELGDYGQADVTELDVIDTAVRAILWVKEGRRRGHIYKIKDGYKVGRTEGDVILDDPKVSNPHARFRLNDEDQFVLWDFGSKNGSFVNGERIESATKLKENDEIKFGDNVFVLKVLA